MPDAGIRFGPLVVGVASTTLFTAGAKTYLRDLELANETALDVPDVFVSIGVDGAGKRLLPGVTIKANTVISWGGVQVLEPGDVLTSKAGTAAAVTATGSAIEES